MPYSTVSDQLLLSVKFHCSYTKSFSSFQIEAKVYLSTKDCVMGFLKNLSLTLHILLEGREAVSDPYLKQIITF